MEIKKPGLGRGNLAQARGGIRDLLYLAFPRCKSKYQKFIRILYLLLFAVGLEDETVIVEQQVFFVGLESFPHVCFRRKGFVPGLFVI